MPLFPGDPFALVGLIAIVATIAALLFSDWPKAYLLALSTLGLFALQMVDQQFGAGRGVGLAELALSTQALVQGRWWTPVTYAFLHADLFHIIGNLWFLVTAGPALEDSVGPRWFMAIYAVAALFAGAVGVLLSVTSDLVSPVTLMVGASGAIFGVLTTYAMRHPREKLPIAIILVLWLPAMMVLGIYLVFNIGLMVVSLTGGGGGIAWYGHFAGFVAGLAFSQLPALARDEDPPDRRLTGERLAYLGTTPETREAVEHLRDIAPGEEEVAQVWLDELASRVACPVCQAQVDRKGLRLVCHQGHDLADEGPPVNADDPTADQGPR